MHVREGGREGGRGRGGRGVKRESTVYNDKCVSPSDAEKSSDRERTVMVSMHAACSRHLGYLSLSPLTLSSQSYEQAFEKIKEATGITDIDQLVSKFIEGTTSPLH